MSGAAGVSRSWWSIAPGWFERGEVVRLRTYRWRRPCFVVVEPDVITLVAPVYFADRVWSFARGNTFLAEDEQHTAKPDPQLADRARYARYGLFPVMYFFTTTAWAAPTVTLQTVAPVMSPSFRRRATDQNSPVPLVLWPRRRAVVYGVSFREERPGALAEAMGRVGWPALPSDEVHLLRSPPLVDRSVVDRVDQILSPRRRLEGMMVGVGLLGAVALWVLGQLGVASVVSAVLVAVVAMVWIGLVLSPRRPRSVPAVIEAAVVPGLIVNGEGVGLTATE